VDYFKMGNPKPPLFKVVFLYLFEPCQRQPSIFKSRLQKHLLMKHYRYLLILLTLLISPIQVNSQSPSSQLDKMIQQGMDDWHIPGLATVVVKEGKVVFSQVYGVKDVGSKAEVDRETLFNMGSTTKAVVCMALGVLVDQGKLQWEDKVRDHLPEFKLSDAYLTEEARVQDLLTHNLGIAGADLLWVLDSTSTSETIKRFSMAKKAYPARGGYQYNNLMYAVAGEVIHSVSGMHWADFVKKAIFEPLQMRRTVARAAEIFSAGNYVTPYFYEEGKGFIEVPHDLSDQIGAAGMIWTCAEDMENYLEMLVGGGVYRENKILEPETFAYLFRPHALLTAADFYPTTQLTQPHWLSYGLGWFQHDYRGRKLDFHTGSIGGLVAIAGIMHDTKTAVYVLANRDHAELRHAIMYQALDLWAFEESSRDWHQEISALYDGIRKTQEEQEQNLLERRKMGTNTSLPLDAYMGTYAHPMLGKVVITPAADGIELRFNDFVSFTGQHWHYDTFRGTSNNRYLWKPLFTFHLGTNGKIQELAAFGEQFTKTD
jgi:CubicO group peptidase (beta-lactamase class C family)